MHIYSCSRDCGNPRAHRYCVLVALFVFCLTAMTGSAPAWAQHSSITPDGALGDWCFTAMLPLTGPDSLTTLSCPGSAPAPTGTEVVWEDAISDLIFGPIDITYFAGAGDMSSVFYTVGLTEPIQTTHVQIAIEVAAGVGNATWYNPDAANLPTLGTTVGITPDYLITASGLTSMGVLWEATTAPGTWTMVGTPFSIGTGMAGVGMDFEFAIPWASFGPGACAGCPVFDLTTASLVTVMAAADSGAFGGTPGAPFPGIGATSFDISDLISEPPPITDTTAPVACPSPGTECEHMDGSSDSFVRFMLRPTEVFADGFESGDTTAWTLTVP